MPISGSFRRQHVHIITSGPDSLLIARRNALACTLLAELLLLTSVHIDPASRYRVQIAKKHRPFKFFQPLSTVILHYLRSRVGRRCLTGGEVKERGCGGVKGVGGQLEACCHKLGSSRRCCSLSKAAAAAAEPRLSVRSDGGLNASRRGTRQNCEQMWPSEALFIAKKTTARQSRARAQ